MIGNFLSTNKSRETKIDYDGASKCNIQTRNNSTSNNLGEAHVEYTWNINNFVSKLNMIRKENNNDLDSNIDDDLQLSAKQIQQSSGFDSKPFVIQLKDMKMKW